jgi:hypothetical protein
VKPTVSFIFRTACSKGKEGVFTFALLSAD